MASSQPPPRQKPETAATTGVLRSRIASHRRARRKLGDVGARRERALAAAEHDRTDLPVAVELGERIDDAVHQLARQCVQLLRPVHQHDADTAVALDEH